MTDGLDSVFYWTEFDLKPSPTSHPVMCRTELRVFIWNHERFRDEVEMFRTLGDLKTLQIFVHPVFPGELITPREVIDSLMWQHGFECLRLGMRASPH